MVASSSTLFSGCSGEEVPQCCKDIKQAKICATLFVGEDFIEAFDVYVKTEQGQRVPLSTKPSLVMIEGREIPMCSLTIEETGKQLPMPERAYIGYGIKDLENTPLDRDYVIAAECYPDISYKDGSVENLYHQWCYGKHIDECMDIIEGIPIEDIRLYHYYLDSHFSELRAFIDHRGSYFSTYNAQWCGTTSAPEHH